jgi:hypothetical protein
MARKKKKPNDTTPESEAPVKNPHAQALGKLGGLKGGKARAAKLTSEQRAEIARKAASARWKKQGRVEIPPPPPSVPESN